MAINPKILESIASPTGGRLTDIGQIYAKTKLATERGKREREKVDMERESLDMDKLKFAIAEIVPAAQYAGAYTDSVISTYKGDAKDLDAWNAHKMKIYSQVPEELKQYIPDPEKDALDITGFMAVKDKAEKTLQWAGELEENALNDPKEITTTVGVDEDGVPIVRDELWQNGKLIRKSPSYRQVDVTSEAPLKSKEINEAEDIRASTINTIQAAEEIKQFVNSPDFIGGTTGDVISIANSVYQQTQQALGFDKPLISDDGIIDETQLNLSKKNMNRFRRAAEQDDRTDSAILQLAYTIAKLRDPGGRLSDADVANAEKTLRSGASRTSILRLLNDTQNRTLRQYNVRAKEKRGRNPGWKPLTMEEIRPRNTQPMPLDDADKWADDVLNEMGL